MMPQQCCMSLHVHYELSGCVTCNEFVYMYVCVCMLACMYVHVYVCIYVYVLTCIYIYMCVCVYICVYVYACICI